MIVDTIFKGINLPLCCHRYACRTTSGVQIHSSTMSRHTTAPWAHPHQLHLAMSLENAVYYAMSVDPCYMCQFDAGITYRTCARVVNWYLLEGLHQLHQVREHSGPLGNQIKAVLCFAVEPSSPKNPK
eukprot:GHRR01018804.1.p1 GENE.GHRR01018804.1~~GHRR01018804.1.p1  ORF type:complete len:128 (-),score=6.33 GHRR01018804.1:736-1119(-)